MSAFTITIGKPAQLTPVERAQRARRAREAIDGAGWAFDEFLSTKNSDLLATQPNDSAAREEIYRDIRCAAELKAHLIRIIDTHQAEEKVHERNRTAGDDE